MKILKERHCQQECLKRDGRKTQLILLGSTLEHPIALICLFWELNYCHSEFKKVGQIGEFLYQILLFFKCDFCCDQSDTYTKAYRGFYKAKVEELECPRTVIFSNSIGFQWFHLWAWHLHYLKYICGFVLFIGLRYYQRKHIQRRNEPFSNVFSHSDRLREWH